MPKAKKSSKRKKYDYNTDRKKLKRQFKKKAAPRIDCPQIRNAWNNTKSAAQNLKDMGLAFDPNSALPLRSDKVSGAVGPQAIVRKPYVVNDLEAEASLPTKDTKSLSRDIIEYVQHMVSEHDEDYKAMARDEKNYYQDTPKQIKRKVDSYKRFHPEEYAAFMDSMTAKKTGQKPA